MADDTKPQETAPIIGADGAFAEGWLNAVPEQYRQNETIKSVKSLGDMAKMTIEAQKLVGSSVRIPKPDASDEEKRAFYAKLGCPDSAEKYVVPEIKLPEGMPYDEEEAKLLTGFCHKLGITQSQYEQLYKYYNEFQAKQYNLYNKQAKVATEKAISGLKQKWGESDYDKNVEVAKRAVKQFASEEQIKFLEQTQVDGVQLGNHPMLVELFNAVGLKMTDDSLVKGGVTAGDDKGPQYPNSPEMYEDDPKWRPWFEAKGHAYKK